MNQKENGPRPQTKENAGSPTIRQAEDNGYEARVQVVCEALRRLRVSDDQVIELRSPEVPRQYGKPSTFAGYFDDIQQAARAALDLEDRRVAGVYATLNPVDPALLARYYNRLVEYPKAATTDRDIVRRVWLPFDFDPVRPASTSASDGELTVTQARALDAAAWLTRELGSAPDIWAFSGNGYHLLFRIELRNNDESTSWVKAIINRVADQFSDDRVSVDRAVFNASRIWKVYGTLARKGDEVSKLGRIHRRAAILKEGFAT